MTSIVDMRIIIDVVLDHFTENSTFTSFSRCCLDQFSLLRIILLILIDVVQITLVY